MQCKLHTCIMMHAEYFFLPSDAWWCVTDCIWKRWWQLYSCLMQATKHVFFLHVDTCFLQEHLHSNLILSPPHMMQVTQGFFSFSNLWHSACCMLKLHWSSFVYIYVRSFHIRKRPWRICTWHAHSFGMPLVGMPACLHMASLLCCILPTTKSTSMCTWHGDCTAFPAFIFSPAYFTSSIAWSAYWLAGLRRWIA